MSTDPGQVTEDGVPIGSADAEADAVRSGADEQTTEWPGGDADSDGGLGGLLRTDDAEDGSGGASRSTEDGQTVGLSDADADRARTTGD
jgi:hypothetical protein